MKTINHSALRWSAQDVRACAENKGINMDGFSDAQLDSVLADILTQGEGLIKEFINNLIEDSL